MIKKLKQKTKEILLGITMLAGVAAPQIAKAENGYFNVQPAYNFTQEHPTARLEGGADITDKLKVWGFLDLNSSKEHKGDFENYFSESRIEYTNGLFGVLTQYETGNGIKDIIRAGFTVRPNLSDDTFTLMKIFPYNTSNYRGLTAALCISQKFGNFYLSGYFDNFDSGKIFAMPEFGYNSVTHLTPFVQGRCSDFLGKANCSILFGTKYNF